MSDVSFLELKMKCWIESYNHCRGLSLEERLEYVEEAVENFTTRFQAEYAEAEMKDTQAQFTLHEALLGKYPAPVVNYSTHNISPLLSDQDKSLSDRMVDRKISEEDFEKILKVLDWASSFLDKKEVKD
jgi:hypothetical protein